MISRRAQRENEPEQGGGDWGEEETRKDGSRVIVEEVTEESRRRKKRKEEMGEEGCEWKRGDERRGKAMFLSVCPVANLISLATP